MADRLPTGISVLDRQLGGGIPAGSIVTLSADPASQSELFLQELTAARGTLYLTTIRSDQAVRDAYDRATTRTGNPTIRDVGGDAPLDRANRFIRELPENATLIIDAVDPLEESRSSRYREFLNELQTHMVNTQSIAILHALKGESVPENRDMSEHMADLVFDLRTEITSSEIQNRLAVPKFRGGRALEEPIKLQLSESVTIDTSRDIA
jgi:KaiC/GvpD/RAD55 family RecA-like ATPase